MSLDTPSCRVTAGCKWFEPLSLARDSNTYIFWFAIRSGYHSFSFARKTHVSNKIISNKRIHYVSYKRKFMSFNFHLKEYTHPKKKKPVCIEKKFFFLLFLFLSPNLKDLAPQRSSVASPVVRNRHLPPKLGQYQCLLQHKENKI